MRFDGHAMGCDRFARRALAAALSVMGLGVALSAQAATFGTGCSYSGNAMAEGGLVGAIVGNNWAYSGSLCGGDNAQSRDTVYGAQWTGDGYFNYSFAQHAIAGSSASASLGALHAYSHSAADSTPKDWWYTDSDGYSHAIDNVYLGYAGSRANASWFDQLTVQQGSAPYGRIYLRFTLQLHGSEGTFGDGKADIGARFIVDDDRNVSDRTVTLDQPGSYSFVAGYYPGTVVKLYGDLWANTAARAGGRIQNAWNQWVPGPYAAQSEGLADAGNTAGYQIEVLTAGATYRTDSGHSYLLMVPEPSTWAMLALGGVLALLRARRRAD